MHIQTEPMNRMKVQRIQEEYTKIWYNLSNWSFPTTIHLFKNIIKDDDTIGIIQSLSTYSHLYEKFFYNLQCCKMKLLVKLIEAIR